MDERAKTHLERALFHLNIGLQINNVMQQPGRSDEGQVTAPALRVVREEFHNTNIKEPTRQTT